MSDETIRYRKQPTIAFALALRRFRRELRKVIQPPVNRLALWLARGLR